LPRQQSYVQALRFVSGKLEIVRFPYQEIDNIFIKVDT
jgi:hypothetical protein